ncbi:MAG: hypothetical protein NC548_46100, partial [Lachnospiraceae bacterium]|nr:hypothetical protein [Lachnospiraceae bacterium]
PSGGNFPRKVLKMRNASLSFFALNNASACVVFVSMLEFVFIGVVCLFKQGVCAIAHIVELIVSASPDGSPSFVMTMIDEAFRILIIPYNEAVATDAIVPFEVLAVTSDSGKGVKFALGFEESIRFFELLLGSCGDVVLHRFAF